ncbi:hypothetical protein HK104_011343 [Borealophlyctis nickersoniae]|nr:hypothetical protein HK104_011343 [Borealophlyctis nickersoniae]
MGVKWNEMEVAIIYYSMYGHIAKLAQSIKAGVESQGLKADLYQIRETLPQEVLDKMQAPPKDESIPYATPQTLLDYDAFLFGFPTRYGNQPAQVRAFWDATGQVWAAGGAHGKIAGTFFSTASLGGGQETTALSFVTTLTHHGIAYVPFGYAKAFAQLTSTTEFRGGSAWGAGTIAAGDGSRQPSAAELEIAKIQGTTFAQFAKRLAPLPRE